MPTPEKNREYRLRYAMRHPERVKAQRRATYLKQAANGSAGTYRARYYANNKERALQVKRSGLPTPTRAEPTLCECCGQPCNRRLALDHCHLTGIFRGWLCGRCNKAIGLLGDLPHSVAQALQYLNRAYSIVGP